MIHIEARFGIFHVIRDINDLNSFMFQILSLFIVSSCKNKQK